MLFYQQIFFLFSFLPVKVKNCFLVKFVKFHENRSTRFQVIAFDGNPTWSSTTILDSQISGIERHQQNKNIFLHLYGKFLENR
jgi:hypothetical protein